MISIDRAALSQGVPPKPATLPLPARPLSNPVLLFIVSGGRAGAWVGVRVGAGRRSVRGRAGGKCLLLRRGC